MQTKKIFILFNLLSIFLLSNATAQVKVEIKNMSYESGGNISKNGPISIDKNKRVKVLFGVEIKKPASQILGNSTLRILYKRSTSDGSGIEITGATESLSETVLGTFYSTSKTVQLSASEFGNIGGILYAEIESASGLKYKSSNWTVTVKGSGTNPPSSSNFTVRTQSGKVFYGQRLKEPNSNSVYFKKDFVPTIPRSNTLFIPAYSTAYLSFKFYITIPPSLGEENFDVAIYAGDPDGRRIRLNMFTTFDDGSHEKWASGSFTFNSERMRERYTSNFQIYVGIKRKSQSKEVLFKNLIPIQIQDVPFITNNSISISRSRNITTTIYPETKIPTITGSTPYHQFPDRLPEDPASLNGGEVVQGDFKYQWQRTSPSPFRFLNIVGATGKDYVPKDLKEIGTSIYRRLATSNNITSATDPIKFTVIDPDSDEYICCNQNVKKSSDVKTIVGNTPNISNGYSYSWEKRAGRSFVEIAGATKKDYLPSIPFSSRTTSHTFRRIITPSDGSPKLISNLVVIKVGSGGRGRKNPSVSNDINDAQKILFPNPASTIINLKVNPSENNRIRIVDVSGRFFEAKNYINSTDNSIEIEVSNLPKGVYFVLVEDSLESKSYKFIKN